MESTSVGRVGIVALIGGLLVAGWGFSVTAAAPKDPFGTILGKLDQILAATRGQQALDLRGVTQNWDKKLNSTNGGADGCNSDRFSCVLDSQAVRDNETGLVWERTPEGVTRTWEDAIRTCWQRQAGGRMGFHLPTIEQLASLVDPAVASPGPTLPPGHPFQNVQKGLVSFPLHTGRRRPTGAPRSSQTKRGRCASSMARRATPARAAQRLPGACAVASRM
jgi:hypothetical protein